MRTGLGGEHKLSALAVWIIGFFLAASGLSYYTELLATFPNRAGGEVPYLEQAYKRPRFLFPVTFAVITIMLGFASCVHASSRALPCS